eukprot:TRINITY_DN6571_c1_g1_i2.p2 TRINITY_DN6571_c1_g1~~TRINITY_DN6571_c1_g1_i2.p2  ORF type:complete len:318 (+),score=148.09 TRINITY_DN6571_c1_g1_i2:86-955(+)
MAAPPVGHVRDGACRIIIGNIPDYVDADMLKPLFMEAGAIVSLELVYRADQQGGKPRHRGYGFCEYEDNVSRDAAVRNLNGRAVQGVSLRVKPADGAKEQHMRQHEAEMREVPRLELEAQTPIAQALKKLTLAEACEMMEQMKQLAADDEDKAARILDGNPQLCMAFLYIFYYFGLIERDPEAEQVITMKRKQKRKEKEREERDIKRRRRMGLEPPLEPPLAPSAAASPPPSPPPPTPQELELQQLPVADRQAIHALLPEQLAGFAATEREQLEAYQNIMKANPGKWLS